MKKDIVLIRLSGEDKQTLGVLSVYDSAMRQIFNCRTLELPWLDNQPNISCVPVGKYKLVYEYSPAFRRKLWELKGVPGRSETKFHVANYFRQLRGCIALGDMHLDIDNDGFRDVRNSRKTVDRFHASLAESKDIELSLTIIKI